MSARIYWLIDNRPDQIGTADPLEQQAIHSNMLSFARAVARPTTDFTIDYIDRNIGTWFTPTMRYPRAFTAVEVVDRIRQAEADGYDAAFPGMCYGEFYLQDARQAVTMPVVGPAESAMMVAQLLGKKFAVLTVAADFEYVMEENIRFHRWEGAAISHRPVRSWPMKDMVPMMIEAYAGRPQRLIEEFDARAQELVRDGADVVICGCNPYGAALSQAGYKEVSGTGVPVVTALASQIKMAETLIDLRRSLGWAKSEAIVGPYRTTPAAILDDLAQRGIGLGIRKGQEPGNDKAHAA